MSYEVIWEPRGAIKRFFGQVTGYDLLQSVVDTERDVRFDELRYVINDFLAMTDCSAGLPVVDDIATQDCGAALSNPRIRIAVVTESPEIITLTKHYTESPINAYETKIFPTLADARAWLR